MAATNRPEVLDPAQLRGVEHFSHGVWTAILAAVLFRASALTHFRLTGGVLLTYLFVSLLHGLWDALPGGLFFIVPPGIRIPVFPMVLSLIGLVVLVILYRQAVRLQVGESTPGGA